jgi:glycosyltransferase involved in cell wall biosynthesis
MGEKLAVTNPLPDISVIGGRNGSSNGCRPETAHTGLQAPHRFVERYAEVDLTLFVACYNEEHNILDTLDTIQEAMQELSLTYEIIVIDDASRDRSVALVEEYQRQNPSVALTLVQSPKNRGLSRNFVEGAFLGRGRYYKLVCGDNADSRDTLLRVLKPVGRADIIVPYHGKSEGRSLFRRFLSRVFAHLVNLASGYSLHYYNGCGVYRRADVMRWHSRTSGFGFQAELLVRLLDEGASFVEVPIVCRERQGGKSSAMKVRNWISVGRTLFGILLRRRK